MKKLRSEDRDCENRTAGKQGKYVESGQKVQKERKKTANSCSRSIKVSQIKQTWTDHM